MQHDVPKANQRRFEDGPRRSLERNLFHAHLHLLQVLVYIWN